MRCVTVEPVIHGDGPVRWRARPALAHGDLDLKSPLELIEAVTRLSRARKRVVVMTVDALLCVVSVIVAYSLRIGVWVYADDAITRTAVIALVVMFAAFFVTDVYRAIFRYAGRGMMRTLMRAGLIYGTAMTLLLTFYAIDGVPRTLGVIQPIIMMAMIAVSRLVARYLMVDLLGRMNFAGEIRNMMIYGAGDAGQQLASSLSSEPSVRLIGYLDDDARLHGQRLDGIEVFHARDIDRWVERFEVTDILLALPGSTRRERHRIVERLENHKVHIQTLPPMRDIVDGRVSVSDIRELEVEDLLGREPVNPNALLLGRTIVGKTVLVTGAGGSIGSELCRQIVANGARRIILFELSEFALYAVERELIGVIEADSRDVEHHADWIEDDTPRSSPSRCATRRVLRAFSSRIVYTGTGARRRKQIRPRPSSGQPASTARGGGA